jgi:hypothetical protein
MEPRLVLTVDQLDEAVAFRVPDGMRRTRFTALV